MLAYRLGLATNRINIEEEGGLLDEISDWQLLRWGEYYQSEPWGNDFSNHVNARGFKALSNMILIALSSFGGKKVDKDDLFKLEDFLPELIPPAKVSPEELKRKQLEKYQEEMAALRGMKRARQNKV